jgi:hypothetical protein
LLTRNEAQRIAVASPFQRFASDLIASTGDLFRAIFSHYVFAKDFAGNKSRVCSLQDVTVHGWLVRRVSRSPNYADIMTQLQHLEMQNVQHDKNCAFRCTCCQHDLHCIGCNQTAPDPCSRTSDIRHSSWSFGAVTDTRTGLYNGSDNGPGAEPTSNGRIASRPNRCIVQRNL